MNDPPRNLSGCKRPSSRLASVTVGCKSAAIADRARIGAGRFWSYPQSAAGIEARQRTSAGAHSVNVEHGHAHRQACDIGFVASA